MLHLLLCNGLFISEKFDTSALCFVVENFLQKMKPLKCSERQCLQTWLPIFLCRLQIMETVPITALTQNCNKNKINETNTEHSLFTKHYQTCLFFRTQVGKTLRIYIIQNSYIFKRQKVFKKTRNYYFCVIPSGTLWRYATAFRIT